MKKRAMAILAPVVLMLSATGCLTGRTLWEPCDPNTSMWGLAGEGPGAYVTYCNPKTFEWEPVMTALEYVKLRQGQKISIAQVPTKPVVQEVPSTPAYRWLSDIKRIEGLLSKGGSGSKIDGVFYPNSIVSGAMGKCGWSGEKVLQGAEYSIERKHHTLEAVVGLLDKSVSGVDVKVVIEGDGVSLWEGIVTVGTAQRVTLPVSGVLRLKIMATIPAGPDAGCVYVGIGDPKLT